MFSAAETAWDFSPGTISLGAYARRPKHCAEKMRIQDWTRKSVVFIGVVDTHGDFSPYGTGFIVLWPEDGLRFAYLITAKHVLNDMVASKRPLVARLNTKDGKAITGSLDRGVWHYHPLNHKCDIAVLTFNASPDFFDVMGFDLSNRVITQEYIIENDIGCGDEVITAGLLMSHFGKERNIPIIRTGNISAMPEEHVDLGSTLGEQDVYLIESRSIGGLSGSPVFLPTPPIRLIRSQPTVMQGVPTENLMGINIGLFDAKAHGDNLPTDTATQREHFLEKISAGIAVVVPIQRVIEIVRDVPILQDLRKKSIEQKDKNIGFVKTSANPCVRMSVVADGDELSADENPDHREDFTALLNAAVRKPQSKD